MRMAPSFSHPRLKNRNMYASHLEYNINVLSGISHIRKVHFPESVLVYLEVLGKK